MSDLITIESKVFELPALAAEAMAAKASRTLEQMKAFAITDESGADLVTNVLSNNKEQLQGLEASRKCYTAPLYEAQRSINASFGIVTAVLQEIEQVGKASINQWARQEAERIRQEQIKRDAEAAAERQRLADEAAELSAKAAEAEAKAMDTPDSATGDAALQQAQELREAAAVATIDSISTRAAPVLASKIKGASVRENWQGEVTDKAALIAYLATHPEYLDLLIPDTVAVRNVAKIQKGNCQIPGLRVWDEGSVSIRTRKVA